MPGSNPKDENLSLRPFSVHHPNMESLLTVLGESPGVHDVMELFGGEGKVVQLSVRRSLVGGRNLDLTTGVDLLSPKDIKALWDYMEKHSPRVVVAGPPCTSFSMWSHINRLRNPTAFEHSRKIGVALATLTAAICEFQLSKGRHFLVENPLPSELWSLPQWAKLRNNPLVCEVTLDQCMVGLCDPDGHPTKKATLLLASHPCLVKRLNRRCQGGHTHVQLAGSTRGIARCKFAQAWPRRMVELIVTGIQELFKLTAVSKIRPHYPV